MKIVSTQDRTGVLNPNMSLSNTFHNCPCLPNVLGLPRWLSGRESPCNAGDPGSVPGWGISPGEGKATHFCIVLPGESYRQKSLESNSPWGCKELDMT